MEYLEKIKEVLFDNKKIIFCYVFGSYAENRQRDGSDMDIAIYVKEKVEVYEYIELKNELEKLLIKDVDLVILNDATPLIKYEIYVNHVKVFSKNKEIENDYLIKVLFEYEDVKKYLNYGYNSMIERIKRELK